jgi:hypothetical protein
MRISTLAVLSVIGIVAKSVVAQATPDVPTLHSTVSITSDVMDTSDTVTLTFAGVNGGKPISVYTNPDQLSGTFGTVSTPFANLFAYCTDLYHYTQTPPVAYTVGHLTSSNQPAGDDDLTATQIANIIALIDNTSHTDHAATQMAIWAVEYNTANPNAVRFADATGSTETDEQTYLDGLTGVAPANVAVFELQADGVQGLSFTVDPVPEPMSMAVLGSGVLGLVMVRRQKANRVAI